MSPDEENARAILRRVEDDQRSFVTTSEPRGAQMDPNDPVEAWAKRTGRIAGYGLLALLILNLFTGWFF